MPSQPPSSASSATWVSGGTKPHMNSAGIVKIVPAASDELAEPIVCAMFASRSDPPSAEKRKAATVSTAIGIDVETGQADAQAQVGVGRAEQEAEDEPGQAARAA